MLADGGLLVYNCLEMWDDEAVCQCVSGMGPSIGLGGKVDEPV